MVWVIMRRWGVSSERRCSICSSLICAWINGWAYNREAGDLRHHCAHYDVIAMTNYGSSIISTTLRNMTGVSFKEGYIKQGDCKVYQTTHKAILIMITTWNGDIFRVTGPLCGEFTGPGEFPTQRPVTRSFDVIFDLSPNKRLSKQPWSWWFETSSWSLWRQCNGWAITLCCQTQW